MKENQFYIFCWNCKFKQLENVILTALHWSMTPNLDDCTFASRICSPSEQYSVPIFQRRMFELALARPSRNRIPRQYRKKPWFYEQITIDDLRQSFGDVFYRRFSSAKQMWGGSKSNVFSVKIWKINETYRNKRMLTGTTSPTIISELCFVIKLAKSTRGGRLCTVPAKTRTCGR